MRQDTVRMDFCYFLCNQRRLLIRCQIHQLLQFHHHTLLLIFYTFETLFISGLIYIMLIPVSFFHFKYLNKKTLIYAREEEETEDVL